MKARKNSTQNKQVEEALAEIPRSMRGRYRRAMSGRSRVAGIAAMCQLCFGYEPGTANSIRTCKSKSCPLWPYRPGQRMKHADKV